MAKFNLNGIAALWFAGMMVAIATPISLTSSAAHANELTEVFADPSISATLKLKDLDETWKRLQITQDSSALSASMFFGVSSLVQSSLRTDVYYTQGKIVTIGKQRYLVVYRPDSKNINFLKFMTLQSRRNQNPESLIKALTPESTLTLSLFNLSTLDGLKDIQPFNLQKEIEESKDAIPPEPKRKESSTSESPAGADAAPSVE